MTIFKKILWSNLFVLLIYNIWFRASYGHDADMVIGLAFLIVLQVVINFILAIIFAIIKKSEFSRAFLLSSGLVLLIGFSTCLGNALIK